MAIFPAGVIRGNAEEPDYRAEVQKYVPLPLAGRRPDFADRIARTPLRRFCEETAVLVRMGQWTGRTEYTDEARQRLSALLDIWQLQHKPGQPWKRMCFFSVHPTIDAYRLLLAASQLDEDFQRRFRQFAREAYFSQEQGPFNQAFARSAGLAWAAKTLPDMVEAAAWRKAAEAVWTQWYQQRDTTENAAAYNAISLEHLFLLADALGHAEQFQDPAVRQMFTRFRDQVSPSGAMPEYGDSGDAQWSMFHCWGVWVCAFERAAAVYHDPTYRWAAVRMFRAACRNRPQGPRKSAIDAMNSAYALCLADQWRDRRLQPQPGDAASAVSYRREPGNDHAADKLILAASRQPGTPFVMAELYARGHHAHDDQVGSILYYECNDVPLLHGLGYHNRAADEANLLLMCPGGEPFPHQPPDVHEGQWQEASLPAKRLPAFSGADGGRDQRHFDKLTFRVAEDEPLDLFVANLRLAGPKGELPLDDFRSPRGWHGGRQTRVAGPRADQQAMKVDCRRGTNFVWRDAFHRTFSLADYDQFKFSWKIEGIEGGWSKALIFRVDNSPADFHVLLRPLAGEITAAHVECHGSDQYGQFRASKWFTEDTQLCRRMVLLREGCLVVCDQLQPGAAADGWQAGPLWHLRAAPQAGPNWYNAPGRQELLVWISSAPGRTCGVSSETLWSGTKPFTVFAKETLKSNRPVQFVSVLWPHGPELAADRLAAGIRIANGADDATIVDLPGPTGTIHVQLGRTEAWSVSRQ
jgi:hypothetical protein